MMILLIFITWTKFQPRRIWFAKHCSYISYSVCIFSLFCAIPLSLSQLVLLSFHYFIFSITLYSLLLFTLIYICPILFSSLLSFVLTLSHLNPLCFFFIWTFILSSLLSLVFLSFSHSLRLSPSFHLIREQTWISLSYQELHSDFHVALSVSCSFIKKKTHVAEFHDSIYPKLRAHQCLSIFMGMISVVIIANCKLILANYRKLPVNEA